jgi:hypothetical protein
MERHQHDVDELARMERLCKICRRRLEKWGRGGRGRLVADMNQAAPRAA